MLETVVQESALTVGRLDIHDAGGLEVMLIGREDGLRPDVEAFARRAYEKAYDARLNYFCRELMALSSPCEGILSCVGINTTETGPLFLEQYLDIPVEDAVSARLGKKTLRPDIVEVGTMAVGSSGLCRLTMASLAGLLTARGKKVIVFTAIRTLRNTLRRLGVPYAVVAEAMPERLKHGSCEWGRYYKARPQVIAIDLEASWGMISSWGMINTVIDNIVQPDDDNNMHLLMGRLFIKGSMLEKGHDFSGTAA